VSPSRSRGRARLDFPGPFLYIEPLVLTHSLTHPGAHVKSTIILAAFVFVSIAVLSGCGNTRELEASLAAEQAAADSLRKENAALDAENAKLKARVAELEKSLTNSNAKAVDLQRQLDLIRADLEKSKMKGKGDLQGAYREALRLFMDRRYEESAAAFGELLADGMPDPLNDNCHYWIGESLFGLGRYREAVARFDEVLAFTWSNKKDDSQLMIARCYARMGETAKAKEEYRKLIDTYPASPYLDLAKGRIGT
jgi:TolA-binding protein